MGDEPGRAGPDELRVGDAERQAVVDQLSRHTSAGRLTLDEFAERAGQVYAARTRGQLDELIADLPTDLTADPTGTGTPAGEDGADGRPPPPYPGHNPSWEPDEADDRPVRRQRRRRRFVAIMSGSTARGRWWAPRRIRALAWWGHVHIDLREAVITSPVVSIRASAYMGGVTVTVPEGIPVDMYGFVLMGGSHNATRSTQPIAGAPLVRVRARGLWGGVVVKSRKQLTAGERAAARQQRGADRLHHHGLFGCHSTPRPRPEATADAAAHEPVDPSDPEHNGGRSDRRSGRAPWPPRIGELPTPTLDDALPNLSDLQAMAKTVLRDKLVATGLLDEPATANGATAAPTSKPPAEPAAEPAAAAKPERQPQPQAAPNGSRLPLGTMTMLVTDIVRSTQIAEQLGDQRWMDVLRTHNRLVRATVADHGGVEVKAQGDGFLMVFASARQAILAAIEIQRSMAAYRKDQVDHELDLRIGLHTGEVVPDGDDIHGQHVVVSVRIADAAAPGEILASSLTRDLTASAGDLDFDESREVSLKGVSGSRQVYRVNWT